MEKRERFLLQNSTHTFWNKSARKEKKYVEEDFQHFNAMDFSNMLNLVQPVTNDE